MNNFSLPGYTKPLTFEIPSTGDVINVLVQPDTDLDGRFVAWDVDCEDFIRINGWAVNITTSTSEDSN